MPFVDVASILIYIIGLSGFVGILLYKNPRRFLLALLFSIVVAFIVIYAAPGTVIWRQVYEFAAGVPIFSLALYSYGKRYNPISVLLCFVYVSLVLSMGIRLMDFQYSIYLLSYAALFGFFGGVSLPGHKQGTHLMPMEVKRNALQAAAGLLLIYSILFLRFSDLLLVILMLIGIALGSFALRNRKDCLSKVLYGLERSEARFGEGAIWLGLGALFAATIMPSPAFAAMAFSAIFIADAASTLVGLSLGRTRLPYNKKKSIEGTAAYFIITFVSSYLILRAAFPAYPSIFHGYSSILLAAVSLIYAFLAALVESLPSSIDDNFDVAVAMTFFSYIILFGSLAI